MDRNRLWLAVAAAIALLWLGAIIGNSFIATPAKFAAASLTRPVAFDVGRATFAMFSKVEWAFCLTLVLAVAVGGATALRGALVGLLVATLAAQALWLLPELNARVAAVIAGTPRPPSAHHAIYAAAELLKCALLAVLAGPALLKLAATGQR